MKFFATVALLALSLAAFAQQNDPEKEAKEFQESINAEVERLENNLELEDWQVFYVDSILTYDYNQMRLELKELSDAKISNYDLYTEIQDKWVEKIYNSLNGVFDEAQWNKYMKMGALKAKKDRDKRAAKRKK